MFRSFYTLALAALVGIAASGCNHEGVATGPDALTGEAIPPMANIGNAPANSGPIVMRGQTTLAVLWFDTKSDMQAVVGVDVVQLCTSGAPFDLVAMQNVDVPEDANRINQLLQGSDMTTSVWPLFGFDCGQFVGTPPLATGTSNLINTDNDVFVLANPDNRNANAFGWQAHGRLTRPSGAAASFSGHVRQVFDGVDPSAGKINVKVSLH